VRQSARPSTNGETEGHHRYQTAITAVIRGEFALDEREARQVLQAELARYGGLPYPALMPLVGTSEHVTRVGSSGSEYQIEIEVRWDTEPQEAIRVMGAIDDGQGFRSFIPLSEDILIEP
jgi:hypothetical protein